MLDILMAETVSKGKQRELLSNSKRKERSSDTTNIEIRIVTSGVLQAVGSRVLAVGTGRAGAQHDHRGDGQWD